MKHRFGAVALLLATVALTGCATNSPYEPRDPLEKINRPIYDFNMKADKYVLRPVAKGYATVTPDPVQEGITNFFSNLFYPTVFINDFLQGKFAQGGRDLGRFLMNSTLGLAGFLDVATPNGLPKNNEDFGQTLGKWGVGEGWYLMLPILGPSTNRDLVGGVGDHWTQVMTYLDNATFEDGLIVMAADGINTRANLLDSDSILEQQLDPYIFLRTAYLERRLALVYDGDPPEPEFDFPED